MLTAAALLATMGVSIATARPVAATEIADCVTGSIGCYPRMTFGVATAQLPNSTAALTTFEAALGRNPDMGLTFTSFRYVFNVTGLSDLARSGITPLITWEPWDPTVPNENRYPLRDLAAGLHDTYLRDQAARIRGIGAPVAIRFAHEMNGSWYPWGAGVNGNTPADYVDAYRHVHDLFAAQGVTDVTWVWAPAALDSTNPPDLADFYPGDAYVDWAGMTAYFDQSTDTWATAVAPTLRRLDAVTPTKPFFLAETGVLPDVARPAMMHDLLDNLLHTPRSIGFAWFDIVGRHDWRIDDDPAALTALREVLSSGRYPVPGTTFAPPAPLNLSVPVIQGTAAVGSTLTATAGTWPGGTSTTGRWLLCGAAGSGCTPNGTTVPSLVLHAHTVGRTVRFEVTATSGGGSTTSTSDPTASVVGDAGPTIGFPPSATTPPATAAIPAYITRVYRDLFDRDPDPMGLASWTAALQQGTPYGEVANGITYSPEFRSALITQTYERYLGRQPDATGLANWRLAMSAGLHIEQMQAGFISSPEFYLRAGSDQRQWITNLYQTVLGRAPASSEVDDWQQALARGASHYDVALGFLYCAEHLTAVIDAYYLHLLRRHIDPTGTATWVSLIQGGARDEEIIAAIVASDEYRAI